jgi:ribosomal protein L11 methyltransferase
MSRLPRRWLELRARSSSAGDRAPLLAEGLLALGGRAAEEVEGWYVTHVPEPTDVDQFTATARERLIAVTGLPDIELRSSWREHEDWAETWRQGLGARRITDRIVVRPTWVEASDTTDRDVVIVLDPGMAFGTAEHGTTRGCLRLLDRVVSPGDRVLDVGSGSGILSIAAAHLGAASVLAVESDSLACEALAENLELNGVVDQVTALELSVDNDWLSVRGPFSGIVANIETGILSPLLIGFAEALERDGWLILSGIMESEWSGMLARTSAAGFLLVESDADGDWRSGLFRRDL